MTGTLAANGKLRVLALTPDGDGDAGLLNQIISGLAQCTGQKEVAAAHCGDPDLLGKYIDFEPALILTTTLPTGEAFEKICALKFAVSARVALVLAGAASAGTIQTSTAVLQSPDSAVLVDYFLCLDSQSAELVSAALEQAGRGSDQGKLVSVSTVVEAWAFLDQQLQNQTAPLDETDAAVRRALSACGGNVIANLCSKGSACFERQDFGKAFGYFDRVAKVCGFFGRQVNNLDYLRAICLAKLGRFVEAENALEQELRNYPGSAKAAQMLAQIRYRSSLDLQPVGTQQQVDDFDRLMPRIFAVETALACNLRCPECAMGGGMVQRKHAFLTFEEFKIIADKIRGHCEYLYLHIWGEPLLNKDIFEMIRYAAPFTRTNISTNGMLVNAAKAEELIASGVSDVIVSIDGFTQEIYEQYRVGGKVSRALEAVRLLQEANLRHGGRTGIIPQFVVFKHNQHEMPQFEEYCRGLGLAPSFKAPYIRNDESRFQLPDCPKYIRPYFADVAALREGMRECANPREVFTILVDGTAVICCHDFDKSTDFGNIFKQDLLEIWRSPKYRAFRKAILDGKAPEFCVQKCMTYSLDKRCPAVNKCVSQPARPAAALTKVNLCCGPVRLPSYINADIDPGADLVLDLEQQLLPFPDASVDVLVCMSAINYFSEIRAQEIIKDVFRALKPGGVTRFGVQDLRNLARKYLERDEQFYFEKLANGKDRFPGRTYAEKFNNFFYGFYSGDKHCQYVYDFETLALLFKEAGFSEIKECRYRESSLPDVDQLDNRPEQMFYLEARKAGRIKDGLKLGLVGPKSVDGFAQEADETGGAGREKAMALWNSGQREEAWQLFADLLEENPADKELVCLVGTEVAGKGRWNDLVKLYSAYLQRCPEDAEIQGRLNNAVAAYQEQQQQEALAAKKQSEFDNLNSRFNREHSDHENVAAAAKWMLRAQQATGTGGVSAMYFMTQGRWDVGYPETTGYIIPSFLAYNNLNPDPELIAAAVRMGDWEISLQTRSGGVGEPVGVYGLKPRAFNTGQIILGWLALYAQLKDQKYLAAAERAGQWLLSIQDVRGFWAQGTFEPYYGPKTYHARIAWPLLALYQVTKNEAYRSSADRAVRWILNQAKPNGWFSNTSLTDPNAPWTHLLAYTLVGLLEIVKLGGLEFDANIILSPLRSAAESFLAAYSMRRLDPSSRGYISLPGTFDSEWASADRWSCVTGDAQLAYFLRGLAKITRDERLVQASDQILVDLKALQFLDGIADPNLFGALPGSFPIGGPYLGYALPNWGTKFFCDAVLQRHLPDSEIFYIG